VTFGRLTMTMQRTVQPVTQIAFAIWPPACPAADRRRWTARRRPAAIDPLQMLSESAATGVGRLGHQFAGKTRTSISMI
jgi:hypothetical protein